MILEVFRKDPTGGALDLDLIFLFCRNLNFCLEGIFFTSFPTTSFELSVLLANLKCF
jgi:hypothetical protein